MSPIVKSIGLPHGPKLQYVEQGDPAGVPVLLLHGYTDSWRSFEETLAHLPASIHAVAVTQRGHGDADRPQTGYRLEDFAADAVALIEALELGPAVIVGHSMGSWIARRAAIDHPDRVLGLVLAGSFGTARENLALMAFWDEAVSTLADPIDRGFVHDFQASTTARPLPDAALDIFVEESLKVPAHVWRETYQGFLEIDFSGELAAVEAPTLVVWGDRDDYCDRAEQESLVDEIPNARLLIYEGSGHALHWEEAERFASDLAAFAHEAANRAGHTTAV
jgi:pimeloyl-ACP methyl ester carboxylesterase